MRSVEEWINNPGESMLEFRKDNNMTLLDLSKLVHSGISHLSDIEHGKSEPSIQLLRDLLWLRDKSSEYLERMPHIK